MVKAQHEFVEAYETHDGVEMDSTETELCKCTWVQILNETGEEAMGKPVGNYLTIESDILEHGRHGVLEEVAQTVSEYLLKMMNIPDNASVLVVGIGNRNVLADSLGVRVADKVWATRQLVDEAYNKYGRNLRPVSVISPGVMGVTGISTAEIIKSISGEIKPSLVILIDALAARRTSRLGSCIQISDTGLTPSGGLLDNQKRQTINSDFLGVPVVCVGIPTVINSATIIADAMNMFVNNHEGAENENDNDMLNAEFLENIQHFADTMFASSSPFVTTKEIDTVIQYSAYVISTAINAALFQDDWMQTPYGSY